MGGHALIQVQDLVGLGASTRTVAREVLKADPLPLVRCHERVEIHAHTVFATTPAVGQRRLRWPIMSSGKP